jgi:hypothetical protein
VFGRDPAQLLDLIFGRPPDRRDREPEKYVLEMRKRLNADQSWARTNIGKSIRRKDWRYNAEKKVFQTGLKIWLFTPLVDSSTKRKLLLVRTLDCGREVDGFEIPNCTTQ